MLLFSFFKVDSFHLWRVHVEISIYFGYLEEWKDWDVCVIILILQEQWQSHNMNNIIRVREWFVGNPMFHPISGTLLDANEPTILFRIGIREVSIRFWEISEKFSDWARWDFEQFRGGLRSSLAPKWTKFWREKNYDERTKNRQSSTKNSTTIKYAPMWKCSCSAQ